MWVVLSSLFLLYMMWLFYISVFMFPGLVLFKDTYNDAFLLWRRHFPFIKTVIYCSHHQIVWSLLRKDFGKFDSKSIRSWAFPPFFIRFNAHVASLNSAPNSWHLLLLVLGILLLILLFCKFQFFCFHKWIYSTVLFIQ